MASPSISTSAFSFDFLDRLVAGYAPSPSASCCAGPLLRFPAAAPRRRFGGVIVFSCETLVTLSRASVSRNFGAGRRVRDELRRPVSLGGTVRCEATLVELVLPFAGGLDVLGRDKGW